MRDMRISFYNMMKSKNSSNNLLVVINIFIAAIIAGLIALNFLVLTPKKTEILAIKNTGIISVKERPLKKLNTEIFDNLKFSELEELSIKKDGNQAIKTGNRNIFGN